MQYKKAKMRYLKGVLIRKVYINFKFLKLRTSQFLKMDSQNNQKSKYKDSNSKIRFNQLRTCGPYPKEDKLYYRILIATFPAFFLVQMLLTYKFLTSDANFMGIDSQNLEELLIFLNSYSFAGIVVLKGFILGMILSEIILSRRNERNGMIWEFIYRTKVYLRLMVQGDYYVSSLMLLLPTPVNIINFFISTTIIAFAFIFLENYCNVRDYLYNGSFQFLLIFRIISIFGSITNCIVQMTDSSNSVFIFYHTVAALVLIAAYFKSGWVMYSDKVLSLGLTAFLSIYINFSVNLYIYQFWGTSSTAFLIHIPITFIVFFVYFYWKLKNKIIQVLTRKELIQNQISVLFNLLDEELADEEDKMIVSALLKYHTEEGCLNHNCYSNRNESYDSQKQSRCKNHQYVTQRESLLKFYILCKYEQYINKNSNDFNTILNYCQFLYWRLGNVGTSIFWLQFLKNNVHNLSISSLIRLNGLLDLVKKDNNQFCQNLFNKKIDIQHLINAERTYDTISEQINVILMERLEVWKMIRMQDINLSAIRQTLEPNFERVNRLSQLWIQISKYLKISNQWKQQYLFFLLFVKNQIIKSKILQEFDAALDNQINFDDSLSRGKPDFDLRSLLDSNTCCIHVFLNDGSALMKKVSNNFTNVTGYSIMEAAKVNLDLLLPKIVKHYHNQMLFKMSVEGRFTDQKIYQPYEVYLINKAGYLIPAFKLFKQFVTEEGQLEYVCLLKKTQQKQITILCDEHFEIDSFSKNLVDQLEMSDESRRCLSHLNLISMIPQVANNSVFSYEASVYVRSDSFQQALVKNTPKLFQYETSITKKLTKMSVLEKQKSLVQTSLHSQFYFAKENLEDYLSLYKYNMKSILKDDKKQHFKLIKTIENKFRINGLRLECDINLKEITNSHSKYYEVKINSLNPKKTANTFTEIPMYNHRHSFDKTIDLRKDLYHSKNKGTLIDGSTLQNIFIKDNGNEPPSKNPFLRVIKIVWVLYCILLGMSSLVKMLTILSIYDQIDSYQSNILYTIKLSIASSTLTSYYQAIMLNAVTPDEIHADIIKQTTQLQNIINADSMKMVIFQESINRPAEYSPIIVNSRNKGISYNQIDFLYFGESIYQSLSTDNNITLQSMGYQQMEEYYYPAYSNFINKAKTKLHKSYTTYTATLAEDQIIVFSVSIAIFAIVGIIGGVYVRRFRSSMVEMMKVHCHFSSADVQRIIDYYRRVVGAFCSMQKTGEDPDTDTSNQEKSIVDDLFRKDSESIVQGKVAKQNNNLNKRSKDVRIGSKQFKKECIYYTKLAAAFILLFAYTISEIQYVGNLITPVSELEQSAYNLFFYVPTYVDSGLIIANRHLNSSSKVNQSAYIDILKSTNSTGQTAYMSTPHVGSAFFDAVSTVFFINACNYGEQWLLKEGSTLKECQLEAQQSFTRGLRAYFNFQWKKISEIYYNTEKYLTNDEIQDYYRSIWMANVFVRGLIDMWSEEYLNQQSVFLLTIKMTTSVSIIFFTVMLLVIYCGVFGKLDQEYLYAREFYDKMMPEFIVAGEKIIKSKLTVIGFL